MSNNSPPVVIPMLRVPIEVIIPGHPGNALQKSELLSS